MANPGSTTDQGIIARGIAAAKYLFTGQAPIGWFGPGQPLPPQAPESVRGRQYDFPVAININYKPRGGEALSFDDLKTLAKNSIVAMLIQRQIDLVGGIEWRIKPRTIVNPDASEDPDIARLTEFFAEPDKRHDWAQWIAGVLDQLMVIDAVSIYCRPNRGGGVYALEVLDGAKIKPLLDDLGHQPLPPDPAYQQNLKGLPALDYTLDELIYFPQRWRPDRLYGYSRLEQAADLIQQSIARLRSQLGHWTHGNIGEGYFEAPKEWTPDDIAILEAKWNQMMTGSIEGRTNSPFVPNGTVYHETKTNLLADTYDEWLIRLLCFPFGVAPTPFMKQSGLGHGSAESDKAAAEEAGIASLLQYLQRLMNKIIRQHFGRADLEFTWVEDRELDPDAASIIDDRRIKNGSSSINEVRDRNGEPPIEGGDQPFVLLPTGPVPVDQIADMAEQAALARQKLLDAPAPGAPGSEPAPAASGKPGEGKEPGSTPDHPEAKAKGGKLEKADQRAQRRLKRAIGGYLKKKADEAADIIAAKLGKAASEDSSGRIESALDDVDWNWSDLPPIVEPIIAGVAVAAGHDALSDLNLFDSAMLKRMTSRAQAYAQNRAAKLVGMKLVDGELVENPDSAWAISETTRVMLRNLVSKAVEDGASNDQLAAEIRDSAAFSSDRAEMIARTETAEAETQGTIAGWKASGVVAGKQWLVADGCCDECGALDGEIVGLDEDFEGGDPPLHPRCECTLLAVLPEDMPEGDGEEEE